MSFFCTAWSHPRDRPTHELDLLMPIDLEMEALHELNLNQWRYTDMGKPHAITHHGKSPRPNGKILGQPVAHPEAAKIGPDWVHMDIPDSEKAGFARDMLPCPATKESIANAQILPLDSEATQYLFNLHDLADDMERGELRDVDPDLADTLDRLSRSVKEQGEEDYRILRDVLPKLHQTQKAMDDNDERHRLVKEELDRQYKNHLLDLTMGAVEKANDFLRIDDMIYRMTLQGKLIAIDVSEVKDITDFADVDEQIHDHEKDSF